MIDIEKCALTKYPEPVLAHKARPIETIDDTIRALADKMIDIMIQTKGVGLAGPQAGVDLQIFVVSVDGSRENARVYINPELTLEGEIEEHEEGCLSMPGIFSRIRRHNRCTVTATNLEGTRFSETGEGLLARAFQHEYDHLQGKIIKDRMSQVARITHRKQIRQLERDYHDRKP